MVNRIKQTSIVYRVALTVCCIAFFGSIFWYFLSARIITTTWLEKLETMVNQRSTEVQKYVLEEEKVLKNFIEKPEIRSLIDAFFDESVSPKTQAKQQMKASLTSYRTTLRQKYFLIISREGKVVFSNTPAYDKINLAAPTLNKSPLAVSLERVIMTTTTDIAEFSYDPVLKEPALYLSTPLFHDNKLIAVVAMSLDPTFIYKITNNNIGLNSTGEVIVARNVSNGVLFINPLRTENLAPFNKFLPLSYVAKGIDMSPAQQASIGYSNLGLQQNYDEQKVAAAWKFIPYVNWGISIEIQYDEILASRHLLKQIILTLLLLLIIMMLLSFLYDPWLFNYGKNLIQDASTWFSQERNLRKALISFGIVSGFAFIIALGMFFSAVNAERSHMHSIVEIKMKNADEIIEHIVEEIELVTQSLVYDLQFDLLKKQDISIRLEREMREHSTISGISIAYAPHQYSQEQRLYAPYIVRTSSGYKQYALEQLYDYTMQHTANESMKIFYLETLNKTGLMWLEPDFEDISAKFVAPCSQEVYPAGDISKELTCVVTVFLDMDAIKSIIESIDVSATGYAYLLSKKGIFIYHPRYNYKFEDITIDDMAKQTASESLLEISKKEHEHKEGFYNFMDVSDKQLKTVFFTNVPSTEWSLGAFFPTKDTNPPQHLFRRYFMLMVLIFLCLLIACLGLITQIFQYARRSRINFFFVLTLPLILAQIMLVVIIQHHSMPTLKNKVATIDSVGLQRFIQSQQEINKQLHLPALITIPTGILIDALSIINENQIKVDGIVWQKYDDKMHKGLAKDVFFPQASTKRVDLVKKYEVKKGTKTIIGWKFYATLNQNFAYKKYPLDTNIVDIIIKHPNINQNILLVPDFSDYQSVIPEHLPGLSHDTFVPGFNIAWSGFFIEQLPQTTTYGVQKFGASNIYVACCFDILFRRDFLNALLIFLLPLFAILFAAYAIFLKSKARAKLESYQVLLAYTGLFLSIILLHRSLREVHTVRDILFIEYFFFLVYVVLLILIVYDLLERQQRISHQRYFTQFIDTCRNFFWDIQLIIWLIITTISFY